MIRIILIVILAGSFSICKAQKLYGKNWHALVDSAGQDLFSVNGYLMIERKGRLDRNMKSEISGWLHNKNELFLGRTACVEIRFKNKKEHIRKCANKPEWIKVRGK